jgi:hypothetical protein
MAITLLDMLLEAELITAGQCDEALQNRVFFGGRIGTNLIELGFIEEEALARFLSRKLAVPYVDPQELLNLPPQIIALIPPELSLQYQVVPLRLENRRLYVATADPSALTAIDEIAFITGKIVKPLITPEVRLVQALGKYYRFAIDERYQQIIDRIEECRQAALLAAARQPLTEPPQPLAASTPPANLPTASAVADEPPQEPWKARIERYAIDETSRSLARAEDPGDIGDTLIRLLGQAFAQAALFLIRGEAVCGWRAAREGEPQEEFRTLRIPLGDASVLGAVVENQKPYLGPLPASPLSARMAGALGGGCIGEALLVPVVLGGRTVVILYAAGSRVQLQDASPLLKRLAAKTVLAFEILVAREKILIS